MKPPYAEITMYSGMCHLDPKTELTEEQCKNIEDKMIRLSRPFSGKPYYGTGVLRSTSYMVVFPEDIIVYVADNGCVTVSTIVSRIDYQDLVGLHDYLKELLAPALLAHQEEGKKMWEEYNKKLSTEEGIRELHEEVLRSTKQEKV